VEAEPVNEIEHRLLAAGLLPAEARRKRELFGAVDAALGELAEGANPRTRWFVPGRLEVLGKRADESGGRALLCAVGRGICVAASPRRDSRLRIADAGRGLAGEADVSGAVAASGSDWTSRAQAAASWLGRRFPELRGADVALASDLPRVSGLASSTAFVATLVTVLADFNELAARREWASAIRRGEDLAGFLEDVESARGFDAPTGEPAGARTAGGDAAAIVGGEAGRISQFAFAPLRLERTVRLEEDWSFVVAASGAASRGDRDAPGARSPTVHAADEILAVWNRSTGRRDATLFEAVAAAPDAPGRIRSLIRLLPSALAKDVLVGRFDQFVEETFALVPQAADFLERGEIARFGEVVDRSQGLAESRLADPSPAAIALARSARELGAAAATAFGGDSGRNVWALTRAEDAEAFRRRWAERHVAAFPAAAETSRFFVTRPGPAVVRL
jgi:galactokinase